MPEDEAPEGIITRDDIEALSLLYDQYEFAIDPTSVECKAAEVEFESILKQLYYQKVSPAHPEVQFGFFKSQVSFMCRAYVRKAMSEGQRERNPCPEDE